MGEAKMGRRFAVTLRGIFLAIAMLSLSACAQFEIADRSVEYNLAIEDATNRMLLLNAVRASKRYPMHFTSITDVNISSPVSGSLGFNIPFGGDAKSLFTVTPAADASSGIETSLVVLNKQEFFRGITTPIKGETFHFYLLQGWPRELLFYMFIRKIDLKSEQTRGNIIGASDRRCDKEKDKKNPDELCDFAPLEETFGMFCKDPIAQFDKDNEPYTNQPGNPCKFMRFQDLVRRLRILDFDVVRTTDTKDVIEKIVTEVTIVTEVSKGPQGKTEVTKTEIVKKDFVTFSLSYKADLVTFEPDIQLKLSGIDFSDAEIVRPPVPPLPEVFLRSPEAMIFYMGELLEVQNRPLKKVESVTEDNLRDIGYTPIITLGSGWKRKKVNLFRVIKGAIAGAAAVTVSHEGDTYHIPRNKEEQGSSMHVLSLVSQIFALHRSSKELPSTSTIRVIGD
jgi:hypothetical protein